MGGGCDLCDEEGGVGRGREVGEGEFGEGGEGFCGGVEGG